VGLELNRLGVSAIDGVDISKAMLDEAHQKKVGSSQVYQNLMEADLTGSLAIDSGSYRGIVSVGTFTHGHLGPASFDELIRVAVPGALCVIGINSAHYVNLGFEDRLDFLVNDDQIGQYELVPTPIYDASDLDDPDRVSNVMVWVVS
jgi:SAM-dependent methyltransferase